MGTRVPSVGEVYPCPARTATVKPRIAVWPGPCGRVTLDMLVKHSELEVLSRRGPVKSATELGKIEREGGKRLPGTG